MKILVSFLDVILRKISKKLSKKFLFVFNTDWLDISQEKITAQITAQITWISGKIKTLNLYRFTKFKSDSFSNYLNHYINGLSHDFDVWLSW